MGLVGGTAQAAQGLSMLVLPLTFISSAYVPVSTLPGWLGSFGTHQPITPMVNAVRGLTGGVEVKTVLAHSTAYYVWLSLIWTAAIVVVFGLLAVVRFSRR
jgi:ABC-2 type transport system permease protein/oleandomycin transport system permease protein